MSQSEFYRGVAAATEVVRACAPGTTPRACAAAVHAAVEPLLRDTLAAEERACRPGCDACCHLPVGITFGEALRLAAAVAERPGLGARVVAEHTVVATAGWNELVGRPCPLLADRMCRVHPDRPLACRALASSDARACAAALRGPAVVPFDREALWRGLGAGDVLAAAEPALGHRELRSALVAVLGAAPAAQAEAFRRARPVGDPAP